MGEAGLHLSAHRQHFDSFTRDGERRREPAEIFYFAENRLEGAYVRFFEHGFEWENLSGSPTPIRGRKATWLDKGGDRRDDPRFPGFLKAGYLRVQIPIASSSSARSLPVFGEPWLGGPLPSISDDLYLPTRRAAERLPVRGEVPVGEPWKSGSPPRWSSYGGRQLPSGRSRTTQLARGVAGAGRQACRTSAGHRPDRGQPSA